jgi:hypothetical protein
MKNSQFKNYLNLLGKESPKLVNLNSFKSYKDLLLALNDKAFILLRACFKRISPVRFTIFKHFILHVYTIRRNNGMVHLIKYLKANHLAIQKFIAGTPVSSIKEITGPGVYPRMCNGLPKFIPKNDRSLIRCKRTSVIRFYLTLFSVYRIFECPGQLKLSTITNLYNGKDNYVNIFNSEVTFLIKRHLLPIKKLIKPLSQFQFLETSSMPGLEKVSWTLMREKALLISNSPFKEDFDNLAQLFLSPTLINLFKALSLLPLSEDNKVGFPKLVGALHCKDEPAGKVRVFAMVDIWTQNVLKSLHNGLFDFLRALPNDGTFDQWASVRRAVSKAKKSGVSFGYDLSAATDRLPIDIQSHILDIIFGCDIGKSWKNLLIGREYKLLSPKYGKHTVKYAVGQPMGALSSWAMLALTHHLIVQYSSYQVYKNEDWFENYELLGDDIVIFDKEVSAIYLSIMTDLGVEINLSKSVISLDGGTVEFAKKTFLNGVNVSSMPWAAMMTVKSPMAMASLLFSLYDKLDISKSLSWISRWCFNSTFSKVNLDIVKLDLLKIYYSTDIQKYALLIEKILVKFDNISVRNISDIAKRFLDPVLNLAIKGLPNPLFDNWEPTHRTSMFVMKTFKSKFLLKSVDFTKDSEDLSREIFFLLFPEFNNLHFQKTLYVWNISSNLMEPAFHIYGALFSVVDAKLLDIYKDFSDCKLSNHNIPNLEKDSDVADRYFEFLKLLERANAKLMDQRPKVVVERPLKVLRKINLNNFKFF